MKKEQYNSLEPYQREVYDKWNKNNRALLIASWIITAVITVISLIVGITQGEPLLGICFGIALGMTFGSLCPGFAHLGFIFKKIKFNTAIVLWIVLGIFMLMLYGILLMVVWYGGMVCIVVDTILFIMKKPLIYSWEDKRVLEKAEEMAPVSPILESTDQLIGLLQMLDEGLITKEEFDTKSAEIMSKI